MIFIFFIAVVKLKKGVIKDDDLEELSEKLGISWELLARRLSFNKDEITGFHKDNEEYAEQALSMLKTWKEKSGSEAFYFKMYFALCHEYVTRRDLAVEICCRGSREVSSFSWFQISVSCIYLIRGALSINTNLLKLVVWFKYLICFK